MDRRRFVCLRNCSRMVRRASEASSTTLPASSIFARIRAISPANERHPSSVVRSAGNGPPSALSTARRTASTDARNVARPRR